MSCKGGDQEALSAGAAEAVPASFSSADREPFSAACLPSAAAPRPRPLRCGLLSYRARRVKAAQEEGLRSGGALVGAKRRALTAVLHLGNRTEAAS
jgi:hypothetical protein